MQAVTPRGGKLMKAKKRQNHWQSESAKIQAEMRCLIDAKVDEMHIEGIPKGVTRNLITNRTGACECRCALRLVEES